jgi:hypothetical protein
VVTAKDVGHGLGIEQRAHCQLGIGQAALGVSIDDVAVAGVHDPDFLGGEIGHLVLEIENAFRAEAVKHRHLADGTRSEACSDAIARGSIDRHPEHGDVGTVELVPIGTGGLATKGREAHEGQIHSLRHVPGLRLRCHCNVLSPG